MEHLVVNDHVPIITYSHASAASFAAKKVLSASHSYLQYRKVCEINEVTKGFLREGRASRDEKYS